MSWSRKLPALRVAGPIFRAERGAWPKKSAVAPLHDERTRRPSCRAAQVLESGHLNSDKDCAGERGGARAGKPR